MSLPEADVAEVMQHLPTYQEEEEEEQEEELQGVTRKKRTATDLLVLTRLFGT